MRRQIMIGSKAANDEGRCGTVTRIMVDPAVGVVTGLVVEPEHRSGLARVVPISLVNVESRPISVLCSSAEFNALPRAEKTEYLPGGSGREELEAYDAYYKPFVGIEDASDPIAPSSSGVVVRDMPPKGCAELGPHHPIRTAEGLMQIEGVLTDEWWSITFLLVRKEDRWWHRVVVVPYNRVSGPIL